MTETAAARPVTDSTESVSKPTIRTRASAAKDALARKPALGALVALVVLAVVTVEAVLFDIAGWVWFIAVNVGLVALVVLALLVWRWLRARRKRTGWPLWRGRQRPGKQAPGAGPRGAGTRAGGGLRGRMARMMPTAKGRAARAAHRAGAGASGGARSGARTRAGALRRGAARLLPGARGAAARGAARQARAARKGASNEATSPRGRLRKMLQKKPLFSRRPGAKTEPRGSVARRSPNAKTRFPTLKKAGTAWRAGWAKGRNAIPRPSSRMAPAPSKPAKPQPGKPLSASQKPAPAAGSKPTAPPPKAPQAPTQPAAGGTTKPAAPAPRKPPPAPAGSSTRGGKMTTTDNGGAAFDKQSEDKSLYGMGRVFQGVADSVEEFVATYNRFADRIDDEQPLDATVMGKVGDLQRVLQQAAHLAGELYPAWRTYHEADIERAENPRKGRPDVEERADSRRAREDM